MKNLIEKVKSTHSLTKEEIIQILANDNLNEYLFSAADETRKKYGEKQVHLWRRSANEMPPLLKKDDPRWPGNDPKYKNIDKKLLSLGADVTKG